ncbi:MAG: laccase domain-containing protein, partial [Magnetococcales bacterium]|nr:laccase domain-containing protein [Magnetococcales bacterium]
NGILAHNILESGLCTGCATEDFFSCYKEGYRSGRFPSVIWLD